MKTGRPKTENPKAIKFTFRMTETENQLLNKICTITGRKRNEVVIDALKNYFEKMEDIS